MDDLSEELAVVEQMYKDAIKAEHRAGGASDYRYHGFYLGKAAGIMEVLGALGYGAEYILKLRIAALDELKKE